jgi:phage shock protein C
VETKRLYLSNSDKKIAGVCGGLGEFFGIDSTLIRLGFVLVFFAGGSGLLAYLVCWALIPRNPV